MKKRRLIKNTYGKSSPHHIGTNPDLPDVSISKAKVKDVHYLSSIYPSEEMMRFVEELIIREQKVYQR